ncbi:uncharacterized protein F4817DRAFT_118039 [Daldinia loculata]|uniref:uncharacterized protein n=1 Tax=Daldinia loculata TaxID=103429 RepID=UPI0020C563F9|nr:uncharacterized protein F4817DRAFT_118039 [Daldinia loculata]KAI1646868.1 hypothetical protein F4817DRAFT_118039 [Daldinia loculata]
MSHAALCIMQITILFAWSTILVAVVTEISLRADIERTRLSSLMRGETFKGRSSAASIWVASCASSRLESISKKKKLKKKKPRVSGRRGRSKLGSLMERTHAVDLAMGGTASMGVKLHTQLHTHPNSPCTPVRSPVFLRPNTASLGREHYWLRLETYHSFLVCNRYGRMIHRPW